MADFDHPQHSVPQGVFLAPSSDMPPSATLKRPASSTFEDRDGVPVKRLRGASPSPTTSHTDDLPVAISGQALVDDLADELMCGCCSALLYRPVIVNPCQHYFCGSCCMLWVRNGGTSCPACRTVSSAVTPSRVLQLMIDILLRHDPSRARTERERAQADDIYRSNQIFRIPPPREASPEPTIPPTGDFVRPCPHCLPGNRHGWSCPEPIPDPVAEPDRAHHIDDGPPPGHTFCGNCENLLAVGAPSTTKCDFCQVSFCGISVPNRCIAAALPLQSPQGLTDVGDLVQSSDVYESFNGNTVEVEYMLDYLAARRTSPRHVYRDIVEFVQSQPRKFEPLLELDIFAEVANVAAGPDVPLDSPRNRICRPCAAEVLLWGLRDWWARERRRGHLPASIMDRPDCPDGAECRRQKEQTHAREFNHIFAPPEPAVPPASTPNAAALPPLPPMASFHILADLDDDDDDELTPPPSSFLGPLAADVQVLRQAVNSLQDTIEGVRRD